MLEAEMKRRKKQAVGNWRGVESGLATMVCVKCGRKASMAMSTLLLANATKETIRCRECDGTMKKVGNAKTAAPEDRK